MTTNELADYLAARPVACSSLGLQIFRRGSIRLVWHAEVQMVDEDRASPAGQLWPEGRPVAPAYLHWLTGLAATYCDEREIDYTNPVGELLVGCIDAIEEWKGEADRQPPAPKPAPRNVVLGEGSQRVLGRGQP